MVGEGRLGHQGDGVSGYIRELRRYDDVIMALRHAWAKALAEAIDQEIMQVMGIPVSVVPGLPGDETMFIISGQPVTCLKRTFMIKGITIGTGERRAL